ncbi:hypothetical protein TD95_005026 [Thielaviopsis punctulata]|uniref:Glycerophosphocholine acyltransferase 1 n=1 Tax=Thielaviopsis punctulata TaxID=72032 RepID=A0A0F4ZBW9_9PEZI|nr:hypothetical protein TD95_005026 [Thielaviopsis punctulata]
MDADDGAMGVADMTHTTSSSMSDSESHHSIPTPDREPTDSSIPHSPSLELQFDVHSIDSSKSPRLSRNPSFSGSSYQDEWEGFPPLDRLTVLDILDSFALPQQLEKLQRGISAQKEKVRRSRQALETRGSHVRERMVEEWRRRVPSADEQLERYRKRMRHSVEKLGNRWNDTKVITLREKISFICGVMNIFISGYLLGGFPQYFHIWYTAQLLYFMPIRGITYHRRGYHYFLADLCYFVNLLLFLSLWLFPSSKRLFTSAYCLAFGNNAVAIIMWRNSLVFHSFDKVTSLFIHIMPCATLHSVVHLISPEFQKARFPAVYAIQKAAPGSENDYATVLSMLAWSSIPYAFWQLSYYFFISIRRRDKIRAGRPTSFTWLRRSYSKAWIGKFVLRQPESLQEPTYMLIQYTYAVLTMLPCKLWFSVPTASSMFLCLVFTWSVYNGATYYIDVFGTRFQKELEALKADVVKWQHNPEPLSSPVLGPTSGSATQTPVTAPLDPVKPGESAASSSANKAQEMATDNIIPTEDIPPLPSQNAFDSAATGVENGSATAGGGLQQRK